MRSVHGINNFPNSHLSLTRPRYWLLTPLSYTGSITMIMILAKCKINANKYVFSYVSAFLVLSKTY